MNIWLAPSAFYPHRGGVEELTLKLALMLDDHGHQVTVVTHRHPPSLPGSDGVEGAQVRRVTFPSFRSTLPAVAAFAAAYRRAASELARLEPQPDVIHVICPSNQTLPLTRFAQRRRVPLVLTTQGEVVMDAHRIYQNSAYLRAGLRYAARSATHLTGCSRWALEQAADFAPQFADAVCIENAVDPADWAVSPLPADPVLCAWGRHVPQKGFDLLLSAFALVTRRNPRARLLIGGSGPATVDLQRMAPAQVEFLGPLDRAGVQAMLDRSRVAVVPSRLEPFGIVALEALACGRGLVYSSRGGLAEAAGGHGISVDPEDTPALAEAMLTALSQPIDGVRHREHAAAMSWSAAAARYEDLYAQAQRTRGRRRP